MRLIMCKLLWLFDLQASEDMKLGGPISVSQMAENAADCAVDTT